jgi:hypothetical protein
MRGVESQIQSWLASCDARASCSFNGFEAHTGTMRQKTVPLRYVPAGTSIASTLTDVRPAAAGIILGSMDFAGLAPLRADVLWLATHKTSVDGRACREYHVLDGQGAVLLVARAFLWGREISVSQPNGHTVFTVLRSLAFPLTGKAAVKEVPSGLAIGTVTRNGTFRDSAGVVRGRFRDARSLRERATESLFQGAMEAIFSTGADSMPSGPDALVLQIDDAIAGTLTYGTLPFPPANEAARGATSRSRRTVLPRFMRKAWRSLHAPKGWKFVRLRAIEEDPRLQLAAALFAAELARW